MGEEGLDDDGLVAAEAVVEAGLLPQGPRPHHPHMQPHDIWPCCHAVGLVWEDEDEEEEGGGLL